MTDAADWSWRSAAPWMGALAALLQFVNAARAFADPAGFSVYFGLPFAGAAAAGFVYVYGVRALFIGGLVVALLATRQRRGLLCVALIGTVMPVGDALLAAQAGASGGTLARHVAIGIYLLVTAWLFHRLNGKQS